MPLSQIVHRLERRAWIAVFVDSSARAAFWATVVLGPIALAARWYGATIPWWSVLVVALVLALAYGLVRAKRERLEPGTAAAWLDRRTGGSGVLVTGAERPDSRWDARVEALLNERASLPAVRGDRPLLFLLGAVCVLLVSLGLRLPEPVVPTMGMFLPWIERLAGRLAALDGLELNEEVVEELTARLEGVRERLEDADTQSLYEALDRLGDRLDREGAKLANSREQIESELTAALAAAERVGAGANNEIAAVLESLSVALAAASASGWLDDATRKALEGQLAGLESGAFDPSDAAALGEALRARVGERFAELAASGAFDPGKLAELVARAEAGRSGRLEALGPGTGGISRGRGDAALTFSGETDEHTERFAERALPRATRMDLEHSDVVGQGSAYPEVAPEEGAAGNQAGERSTGAGAWRRRVAPRHRRAVREFFQPRTAGGDQK